MFACTSGTISWILYPIIQCAIELISNRQDPRCRILPLKSWYPFDVESSPNYEIAFMLQTCGQIYVGIGKSETNKGVVSVFVKVEPKV